MRRRLAYVQGRSRRLSTRVFGTAPVGTPPRRHDRSENGKTLQIAGFSFSRPVSRILPPSSSRPFARFDRTVGFASAAGFVNWPQMLWPIWRRAGTGVSSRAGAVEEDGGGGCARFLETELALLDQLERSDE